MQLQEHSSGSKSLFTLYSFQLSTGIIVVFLSSKEQCLFELSFFNNIDLRSSGGFKID